MNYNLSLIERDSEFKYYFLGFVAADGYISKKSNRIEIALKKDDESLLKMFRDVLLPDGKIKNKIVSGKYHVSKLSLENKVLKKEVMKYINTTNKTEALIFPYGIPDQFIPHFMRGYIDGDGNISVKRGQRKFGNEIKYYYGLRLRVLGTRAFLQGLIINLNRLCSDRIKVKTHKKDKENVYYVEFGFSAAEKVLNYVYDDATYYLKRKYDVFQYIVNLDSDVLARNYGTPDGHYNMRNIGKTMKR